ncbi:ABC transporter [Pochonia chlamydosporia 170]|uniref:ABC transporter n=1 Tax=Pochonia chlamydosporia 170 TaxID=1380566 RepID=A0A179EWM6_METCM|nr:ABC transporter [Pochonia chlamydosporia 170]OAQ57587.1 ABC transporter [Pochonia chlamydosporia 170]
MALKKQIWTLMSKNFRAILFRHVKTCIMMAFVLPIVLSYFFSFAKNLYAPPANYGIGKIRSIMTLPEAFSAAKSSGRTKIVLVNNGFTGGNIDLVLEKIANAVTTDGSMDLVRVSHENDLVTTCRSSLRGVTACFCAVVMRSSPNEGPGGLWNYTIRTDAVFWSEPVKFDVDKSVNVEQVYILPMQKAVDAIIANINGSNSDPLAKTEGLPFASMTQKVRDETVRQVYHRSIINFMAVAFIANILWITYHLTGFVAAERESGMSQLLDSMMPVSKPWKAQAARIIAHHLSFSMIYAPAWMIGSVIIRFGVFVNTSIVIILFFNLFSGLALASMSILFASFFKKAQLSGITATISIVLLGILAQALTQPTTGPVAVLSVLFTPCNYVYFLTFMAKFEKWDRAANLVQNPPASSWEMPGIAFFIIVITQIIIYPLLGALVEMKLYGTTTEARKIQFQEGGESTLAENAIELDKLTKIYYPSFFTRLFSSRSKSREPVVAVNELSFQAGRGQIVALLGANGSGKSTTLDAIAGLHKLTSGSITIDGRGGLGITPQKNVLWEDLTVAEHLTVFNVLKAPEAPASKAEITDLIRSIDLYPKRNALAKTLSGGQKRKLQLGMMLTGGSAVCCVDEVSSGLDPLSRRKIWDILLAERGRRTLILTTHFLDEADLLADHIAILSKGTLRAEGSSVELKDRFGSGYRVHVQKNPGASHMPSIPGVQKKESFDLVTYVAPTSNLAAQVIMTLEDNGITQYRFSGPTIEDVFLQVAEEIKDEDALKGVASGILGEVEGANEKGIFSSKEGSTHQGLKLLDGKRVGFVKQAMILYRKRVTVLKRNWILYLIAFLLPIFAAGLTALYVKGKSQTGCIPADQPSSGTGDAVTPAETSDKIVFLAGPASKLSVATITGLLQPLFNGSISSAAMGSAILPSVQLVDTFDSWRQHINDDFRNITTAVWFGDDSSNPTIGWVANSFLSSSITAQQLLDVILTNTTIATTWSSFDVPFNPGISDALSLVVYMSLALACYPAFFALYPSNERRRFVRALQYSNGVQSFPLWVAYLLFDFTVAVLTSAIVTALWARLSNIWFHLEYVFIVLFLYGLASILYSYIISLFTKSQLATFAWSAATQAVFFLGYLIAYICVVTYVQVSHIDSTLLICHFVISAFSPIASATRAMFLATNLFATACDGNEISTKPMGLVAYGGPILYLVTQCIVLFGLLLWFDSGNVGASIRGLFDRSQRTESTNELDAEMTEELTRVTSTGQTKDGLRVVHLTKSFKKNTAVDNVTFGIKRGEVFALLGPNGAGKSTTISLIRGDIKPSRNGGDIFVENVSVSKNLAAARTYLGVCPQIDALDQMTVREHLEFYARIRGIPDIEHNVAAVLRAVGLEAFASRMGYALSGGNKRKLSLGIALMGNPTVVLLDEPSSGLDAASKRIMWKTLAATVHGRSILLTTHSMEEVGAVAGRAGILSRRMLAVGTPDNLRHRFGDALHVHLVSSTAPRTTDEEMQAVISWIQTRLPSANVDAKTYHGQLRFSVSANDVLALQKQQSTTRVADIISHESDMAHAAREGSAIGQLVVLLEVNKKTLGISHYSVSPTTLDEVFLTIVGQHNVKEENYEEQKKSKWSKVIKFSSSKQCVQ